jgi:hypothetical protein
MKTRKKLTFSLVSAILAMFAIVCMGCPDNGTESTHTHEWGDWVVTTPATCTTAGVETRVCALDATHTETQAIPIDPDAHDWGEWEEITPATVEAEGVETKTCKRDATHKETRPIPKLPYTVNSVAALGTWLASQSVNTPDTAYRIQLNTNNISNISTTLNNSPNKYVFLDLSGSTITTIPEYLFFGDQDTPSNLRGCATLTGIIIPNRVTSIGQYAFGRCVNLISVTIPNSVTSIGGGAFINCTNLASITIPNSVTSIVGRAFSGCTSLTVINVDADNSAYTAENGVLYNKNKTTLVAYPSVKDAFTIPDSVTSIGDGAFSNSTELTSVTIPNSVTSIGEWAFYFCTNLTSITIGNGVTRIEGYVFVSCGFTSVTIPDNVTSIGEWAFGQCASLTSVIIPNNVSKIEDQAFWACTNLISVKFEGTIPSSGFASNAFGDSANPNYYIGDLRAKYLASGGGIGTYTRPSGESKTWTKQN